MGLLPTVQKTNKEVTMQRYFVKQMPQDKLVELPTDAAHHFVRVMRATSGSQCEVVLPDQRVFQAELVKEDPATVKLVQQLDTKPELPVQVVLACGLPKTKGKPELIVQKGTELGASRIVFFDAQRSISQWRANKVAKKLDHLQKIAHAAAEQSHRTEIPQVAYYDSLTNCLDHEQTDYKIVAYEESAKQGEHAQLVQTLKQIQANQSLLAVFGPEGGLTEDEVQMMAKRGIEAAGLGPRILRTETAPLYFLACVSYQLELN